MESRYLEDKVIRAMMTYLYESPVEELHSKLGPEEFANLTERILSGKFEHEIRTWVRKNFPKEPRRSD